MLNPELKGIYHPEVEEAIVKLSDRLQKENRTGVVRDVQEYDGIKWPSRIFIENITKEDESEVFSIVWDLFDKLYPDDLNMDIYPIRPMDAFCRAGGGVPLWVN